jgi:hypothetical protein
LTTNFLVTLGPFLAPDFFYYIKKKTISLLFYAMILFLKAATC